MDVVHSPLDVSLARFAAQDVLFAARPSRLSLSRLDLPAPPSSVRINIWRNHGFEPFEPLIDSYARFGRWQATFTLSSYDDSLSFTPTAQHADAALELVWLDFGRILPDLPWEERKNWLLMRLQTLRRRSQSPILLATWIDDDPNARMAQDLQAGVDALPACHFADLAARCDQDDVALLDSRSNALAGTRIGRAAQVLLARHLACSWLPAALFPALKAVAVDLDNTLYLGVLGEDGAHGVQLDEPHRQFQEQLLALKQQGVYLALVSRNEQADVQALFEARQDFPLHWSDFSATEVSWQPKSEAIQRIAASLRIGTNALLFVDDNGGELAEVCQQLPQVQSLMANLDAAATCRALSFYPGLWRWRHDETDLKRVQDLGANAEREALASEHADLSDYFRSLQIHLSIQRNEPGQLPRLAELTRKTNQFNLAMARSSEVALINAVATSELDVLGVSLQDRLSDSGVIATLAVKESPPGTLLVQELCISCRAMGRKLEDSIVLLSLQQIPALQHCDRVVFHFQEGPRNQPAREWLQKLLELDAPPAPGLHGLDAARVRNFQTPEGLIVENGTPALPRHQP